MLELIIALGAAGAVLIGVWRWASRRVRSGVHTYGAFKDAVLGREAVLHPDTGAEIVPASPGLGHRMSTVETAVVRLAESQARWDDHESRIARLEKAEGERLVSRTESIELLRTIETALRSNPHQES